METAEESVEMLSYHHKEDSDDAEDGSPELDCDQTCSKAFHETKNEISINDYGDNAEDGSSEHERETDQTSNNTFHETATPKREMIGKEENETVKRFRILLFLVLALVGFGICMGTYYVVNKETSNDSKLSFTLFANSIESVLNNHVENLEEGMRNLGVTISDTKSQFPFVTVEKFETHGEHARSRSKLETITYAPFVNDSLKEEWEKWSFRHQDWIEQSRATFGSRTEAGPVYLDGKISSFIYRRRDGVFAEPFTSDTYAPIWYLSPPPFNPAVVNFDIASKAEYRPLLRHVLNNKRPGFSPVTNVEQFTSLQLSDADHLQAHEKFTFIKKGIGYDQPHSLYAQPVFENSRNDNIVVGVLVGAIAWDAHFANLLPDGAHGHGVICILRSVCGDQDKNFTYQLNGQLAMFLGEGDLHDPLYDNMVREIPFFSSSTGFGVQNAEMCDYSVNVYPSRAFDEYYDSNITIIAVATVGATFVTVALIFFIYDKMVDARNRKVAVAAERSIAVVSSIFPENVRDRVMAASDDEERNDARMKELSDAVGDKTEAKFSAAIADLYPDATIMFADIAGFTAWSSTREPSQVFTLLETLFGAFDSAAKQRRVFKVETVGDCYVAACGLPEPRNDHAVVMARFARDCLLKTRELTKKLECTLGPDTANLAMRIGLHSGPITAGVLRGDNARFQLFGDTMNTASRVESNGERDRIHISKDTADLLIVAGKAKWVTKREDEVYAKGKGVLETYWLS